MTTPPDALYRSIRDTFARYGLDSLWTKVEALIKDGYDTPETILPLLRNEQAYKDRFRANEARRRQGLRELDPGEYIALEEGYRQVLANAGLPHGFYDSNNDLTGFIERDLSPVEMQSRVNTARDAVLTADPNVKRTLKEWYGVGDEGVLAYFLDPDKASTFLDQQYQAAKFAGTAQTAGIGEITQQFTKEFTDQNADWTKLDVNELAGDAQAADRLSAVWKSDQVSTADLVRDQLGTAGSADARKRKKNLASAERAAWSGSSATGAKSLSSGSSSGML